MPSWWPKARSATPCCVTWARCADLISDLLESERLSQPHAPLQREPTDLAGLLQSVRSGALAELPLTLDLPPDLPSAQVGPQPAGLAAAQPAGQRPPPWRGHAGAAARAL